MSDSGTIGRLGYAMVSAYFRLFFFSKANISISAFKCLFNPLPDDKILGLPKLKAFADDKLNVTQNVKVDFHRIENTVGKDENAGYR